VAADTAEFGFVEPRLGRLPLDGGIVTLTRQLPMKFAMDILLTGRRFSADEALRMGVVNEVVPAAELDAAIDRWLGWLLASAPLSMRAIKQVVKRTEHLPRREARSTRLPALMEALTSEDVTEGTAAFRDKRPPQWKGR
jgi:crotonobetainyl-CoA hydratase